ncbi:MAG TPA: hypothetical protein VHE35_27150 [Kofleriaceae bacterium]|nr:hypothetical protein [Kofleriaceae bacterium]
MKTNLMCMSIAVVSMIGAGSAFAGGSEGTVGVGAEFGLSGTGGLSVNYDAGKWHAGGFLAFHDEEGPDNTAFGLGGRFFWHVHSTPTSDFSVGGSLALDHEEMGPDTSANLLYLEPGVQIRAFISGNVALSATAGFSIGLADASGVDLTGQVTGFAGIHYYFF